MGNVAAGTSARTASKRPASTSGDALVCAFNELRTELVSTLYYLLGNQHDAQDAAQEAFIKCWRARDTLHEVRNLRAWIFRVGLNAAKDLQRSAWRRRARPLLGTQIEENGSAPSPADVL